MEKKKIFAKIIENFRQSKITALAENLTYVSLISIFPILAIVLGVTKGFSLDILIIKKLQTYVPATESQLNYFLKIVENLINSLNSSILSIFGFIIMIYTAITLLIRLETTINIIWHTKKSRNLGRSIVNYVALIFILPIFLVLIFITNDKMIQYIYEYIRIGTIGIFVIKSIKFAFITLILTIMYTAMPNTKVRIKSSLISSVLTIIVLGILSEFYGFIQISISKYNAIYGSLAFIPLFLIWAKYFWIIILSGAQFSYFLDNYEIDEEFEVNISDNKKLSILILAILAKKFEENNGVYSLKKLHKKIGVSTSAINNALYNLENMGYISRVLLENENIAYQISKNPDKIYLREFIKKYETEEGIGIDFKKNDIEIIEKLLDIKEDVLIKDIGEIWK